MTTETVLKNANIVLPDEVISGTVKIVDGIIVDITSGSSVSGEDMEGDYLTPGLVELHTDHLEGHYAPRPKVRWNPIAAVQAHDAQIAASGITTVFDALRIGFDQEAQTGIDDMRKLSSAIAEGREAGRLRADHFLHLRCEVSAPDCLSAFERFGVHPLVKLVSLMDHAPGQRQFTDIETYKSYYMSKLKVSEEEFIRYCEKRMGQSQQYSASTRKAIANACTERGIVLASHDDATVDHVAEATEQGIRVAEFPTTHLAAKASKESGMSVLMGAPNVVRGGSHSGNVSARELAEAGHLDIISSDYIPASMMQSAFFMADVMDAITLPQAIKFVSSNPAKAVGLQDRGEIAIGKRGDLVRVQIAEHVPIIRTVWREGRRVI
ncbi:alpha-D-ribose 1-methylphosphonate 5-triphosphate diphosphatase [Brucella pseudogrignonensis]|jgi:alpha-D-ribose 1-methylphosphonate 5-triphosphate diphosphatase|uniref:Alpha-D-ribose 1-methylphosphonate 5-triphosphate diphosphatase n=1 Tax=Brucella pseudogrignonensis TaxID=419475 RepID=A0A7Y3TA44_9HYPH|nr:MULTISPECIES: alpha-D-ribose 1-methylphosphonate 5-triphosphate diphosphatase [Brucella]EMG54672.1 phosphonate metabolism protein PhnM [Ochrobactrum sp. CDB2]KAB2691443.1 alpha-D-ribose 1-methylphosphonate 5-triphosphate diphosphatase [Brucella pseudogrignonensis]MBO1024020.1 alpha-D-ribose 1-methylphosphonate 5-triphosphate diphosphatase [Ochrobactrum sp. SD129]NNV23797.1 alpha-D-ribose 1-methylphosphonate 5-triphosphate diphosphatase [Brucella pseudogrignonensis]